MNRPAATMAHGESRDGPSPLLSSCGLNTVGMEGVSCSPSSSPRLPVAGASACPRVGIRTRHLLDGMPEKAAASGKDRFDGLTDDLLRHVTSFLPANDALQTCVLDTRWRDFWRRTTNLLLVFDEGCERFKQLVKLFINLRGNSPLNKCEISACPEDETDCTYTNTKLLIEYSLACQLKDLLVRKVGICNMDRPLTFDAPLISRHLKTIDLVLVNLEHSALDFSGCLVLEVLRMQGCRIRAHRMSSKSLKHLWITDLCSFPTEFHVRICAPGLISLQLDGFLGLSPFLENMPFLITAYVELGTLCSDVRYCHDHLEDCDISFCSCHAYPVGEGVLLNGLSNAANLELIAHPRTFTYDWDLEWCLIFGKLKTLLLNDWWAIDQLVCILQHSPNLEMLTLHLENTEELVSATGGQEAIEQPFVCAHLKVVNIECRKVDEGICKIWKILTRSGILHEQISIKDGCFPPSDSNIEALELWEPRRPCPPLMARWMCAQS